MTEGEEGSSSAGNLLQRKLFNVLTFVGSITDLPRGSRAGLQDVTPKGRRECRLRRKEEMDKVDEVSFFSVFDFLKSSSKDQIRWKKKPRRR